MKKNNIIIIAILFLLSGCASVSFQGYKKNADGTITEEKDIEGYLYYPPKPYLFISKSEKGYDSKIISFPDTSRPHRVKYTGVFGSADLGFEVQNGMISSFNSKKDSNTSELFTSIGTLGTAKAAIMSAKAEQTSANAAVEKLDLGLLLSDQTRNYNPKLKLSSLRYSEQEVKNLDKNDIKDLLKHIILKTDQEYKIELIEKSIADLNNIVSILNNDSEKDFYKKEITIINKLIIKLSSLKSISYPEDNAKELISKLEIYKKKVKIINNELKSIASTFKIYSENHKEFIKQFILSKGIKEKLDIVTNKLTGFYSQENSIEGLYEIEFIQSKLTLRKVSFE